VQAVKFTNGQAIVANNNASIRRIVENQKKLLKGYGMKINLKKTEVMKINRKKRSKITINIIDVKHKQVKQFSYLGSMVIEDCKSTAGGCGG